MNEKIEGFFDLCNSRGLSKDHGVIIPVQNVNELMLKDEVVEAVKSKKFHIYPVERVEDAIEILTGVEAGKRTKAGNFNISTIFGLVEKNLKEMRRRSKMPPGPLHKKKRVTS